MNDHLHMIISAEYDFSLSNLIRDFKKFASKRIVSEIEGSNKESRKKWILWLIRSNGKFNPNNSRNQFWQQESHPIELSTSEMIHQKVEYIHQNPVKAGIVWLAEHYIYSSAVDYAGGKGLIELEDF